MGLPKYCVRVVIMVMVEQLTEYAHFIVLWNLLSASSVAEAFLTNVFKLHGMPITIGSDRNVIFLSSVWQF